MSDVLHQPPSPARGHSLIYSLDETWFGVAPITTPPMPALVLCTQPSMVDPPTSEARTENSQLIPALIESNTSSETSSSQLTAEPTSDMELSVIVDDRRHRAPESTSTRIKGQTVAIRGLNVSNVDGEVTLEPLTFGQSCKLAMANCLKPSRTIRDTEMSAIPSKSKLPMFARKWRESLVNRWTPSTAGAELAVYSAVMDSAIEVTVENPVRMESRSHRKVITITEKAVELASDVRLTFGNITFNAESRHLISAHIKKVALNKRKVDPTWANVRSLDVLKICTQAEPLFWVPLAEDRDLETLFHSSEFAAMLATVTDRRGLNVA
jgi:hypothetical protein